MQFDCSVELYTIIYIGGIPRNMDRVCIASYYYEPKTVCAQSTTYACRFQNFATLLEPFRVSFKLVYDRQADIQIVYSRSIILFRKCNFRVYIQRRMYTYIILKSVTNSQKEWFPVLKLPRQNLQKKKVSIISFVFGVL